MSAVVVHGIGALCTCDPLVGDAPGVVRDAALVARDGVIVYAGPESGLDRSGVPRGALEVHARGAAVLPGFVDAHTHIVWLGDRGDEYAQRAAGATYEEIAATGGGIRATVRATAAGSVDELATAGRERARRMLAGGTTTVEVKSGYGLEYEAEMRQLDAADRLRQWVDLPDVVATYLPLHAPPEGQRDAFIKDVCTRGVTGAAKRARFVDAFCETGAYTVAECERLFTAGRAHGLRPKIHAEQRSHSGGALLAARAGAVSADHLEHASNTDLEALGGAGVVGVILPGASMVLGGPPPPGRRLLEAGCVIAVATDCNPGTCYSESMPLMISLAVALAGLTPAQALVAATTGGAAALGLADRGMLRPGLRCDAVILNTPGWVDVAYHLGGDIVASVMLEGRLAVPSKV
ncbi:MAG TPA: imidazolonepropionase [Candidatus Saccharimonadales bacterium]|nr:imidazolonepropionase [Candidatus Saccharimonadales bacterium]